MECFLIEPGLTTSWSMNYGFPSFKSRPALEGPLPQRRSLIAGCRQPGQKRSISACPLASPGCRGEGWAASQKLVHGDSARPASVVGQEWLDGFRDLVAHASEQTGSGPLATAIINPQGVVTRIKSGPDILSGQPTRHGPVFFQDIDRALRGDAAQEMNPSGGQRQGVWHLPALAAAQMNTRGLAGGLSHGLAVQWGWRPGLIPGEEAGTFAAKGAQRREVIFVPEAAGPQPVEAFDQPVAGGFARRNEDQFNAQIQGQAHELPKDPGREAQAGKGRIVVELQKVWQSDGHAALQQMGTSRGRALVGAKRLVQGIASPIHSVKGKHFVAARQIAGNPVTGLQDDSCQLPGVRIVRRRGLDGGLSGGPLRSQPAFERSQRRQGPEPMPAQFLLNGPRPDQPDRGFLQAPPHAHDERHRGRRVLLGRMLWGAGSRVEGCPALVLKALLPFEEPRTGAPNLFENVSGRFPFIKEPECQSAIMNFVSLFSFHPQTIMPAL